MAQLERELDAARREATSFHYLFTCDRLVLIVELTRTGVNALITRNDDALSSTSLMNL